MWALSELQRRVAEMFRMDAGLFVPTGTMGNLISGTLDLVSNTKL